MITPEILNDYRFHRHLYGTFIYSARTALRFARAGRGPHYGGTSIWRVISPFGKEHRIHGEKARWCEKAALDGLRRVGWADDIIHLGHTGWYADEYGDETVRGVVYQLPTRDGLPRYVYGAVTSTSPEDALLVFTPACHDRDDAAQWADDLARMEAEAEREYQARETTRWAIDAAHETIVALRRECLALLAEIKGRTYPPATCVALRAHVSALLTQRRAAFAELERLEAE